MTPAGAGISAAEGTDLKYGARHLKRAIERHVVYPLASLLATEQVSLGDVISIDWDGGEMGLTFLKEAEGALVPMASPAPDRLPKLRRRVPMAAPLCFRRRSRRRNSPRHRE